MIQEFRKKQTRSYSPIHEEGSKRRKKVQTRFQCVLCENTFSGKVKLNLHVQTVHHHVKTFECGSCSKKEYVTLSI